MKKKLASLLAMLCSLCLLCGCEFEVEMDYDLSISEDSAAETQASTKETQAETEEQTTAGTEQETQAQTEAETQPQTDAQTEVQTDAETQAETEPEIVWGETYTAPEDVAEYLHIYGELPENFITKKEAKKLGWESSEGNLWEVAPGMSIGGDYFGNYEGILPDGDYRECDVNFDGGYRGAERIIYGEDGSIYYTDDHYKTFTQLY